METNWTAGTTFLKWFFTTWSNIGLISAWIVCHLVILFKWDEVIVGMTPYAWIVMGTLLNGGLVGTIVYSILIWRKEANKLKK